MPVRRWLRPLSLLVLLSASACSTAIESLPAALRDNTPIDATGVEISVAGLACPQCATNIDLQLLRVPGVQSVQVDLALGQVDVEFTEAKKPSRMQLARAIADSGVTVLSIETK